MATQIGEFETIDRSTERSRHHTRTCFALTDARSGKIAGAVAHWACSVGGTP